MCSVCVYVYNNIYVHNYNYNYNYTVIILHDICDDAIQTLVYRI